MIPSVYSEKSAGDMSGDGLRTDFRSHMNFYDSLKDFQKAV